MKLNTKNSLWYILGFAAVIYLALSLAIPFAKTATYWLAFLFGLVALAAQIVFFRNAFDGAETIISKLYGLPIVRVGLLYLVAQMVASLAVMALAAICPAWVPVLLGIVLLSLGGIGLTGTVVAREVVERREAQSIPDQTGTMKQLRARAESFAGSAPEALRDRAASLAESVRYSDPVTSEAMAETDAALLAGMEALLASPDAEGLDAFSQQLAARNAQCKALK